MDTRPAKPLLLQSGSELMDSALGERATDALMASGGQWVKAISEGRLASRHASGKSR